MIDIPAAVVVDARAFYNDLAVNYDAMTGTVILLCGLIGWTVTPLWFAHRMLRTQDI